MHRGAQSPATRGDLASLREELKSDTVSLGAELRSEMKSVERRLCIEIIKTNGRIDDLAVSLRTEMREGNSTILKAVEDFAAQTGKVDRRQIIMDYRVDGLEKRVQTLEGSA